jgi:DNA repair protein RadC
MASSIIIAHNHPSNNLRPSDEDEDLTKKIRDEGKLLGIKLLIHLILGADGSYVSFTDEGWL